MSILVHGAVWRARKWLDELLEAVREHVCRGCSKLPSLHGLTVGMDWFREASKRGLP